MSSNFDPAVSQVLERHPDARILADARTRKGVRELFGVDEYPGSVLYAKMDWLKQNTDIALRLARAIQASLRWIHHHSVDEIMSLVPPEHLGDDRTATATHSFIRSTCFRKAAICWRADPKR